MRAALVCLLVIVASGCSHDREECQAVSLALVTADGAFLEMASAAARGNRDGFERARADFEGATRAVGAIEVSGSSLLAEATASTRDRYTAAASRVVPAYVRLLEVVEATPQIGERYSGGVPPLSAGGALDPATDEADSELRALGTVARTDTCGS
jgi:hypothetical protein